MAVPVVASLARQYPDLRITVLSRPFARVLFEGLAPNVGFMGADIKKEYAGLRGMNALYRRLVAKNITAVADFHNILRSNYLRLRFNLGHYHVAHINKHRRGKHRLTRSNDKVMEQQPTSFHNYLEVLARLGYTVEPTFTSIFPPEGGHLRLLPHVIGEKKKFQQWIGIAPFAAHKGKIYPEQNMEKVIVQLIQRHPSCRIFLFGGGGDEKVVIDGWAEKYKNCVNASAVVGGLKNELILMSHLDVMISMDSANMHLASLTATPVVSIWGATHPFAGFMGWHQNPDNAIGLNLPCRPCSVYGNKPCLRGDYACLKNISPEMVRGKVAKLL